MKWKNNCPVCHHELSFWNAFRAITPFVLTCTRCKAGLRVKHKYLMSIFVNIFIVFAGLLAANFFIFRAYGLNWFIGGAIIIIFLWILLEVALIGFIYQHAEIIPKAPEIESKDKNE